MVQDRGKSGTPHIEPSSHVRQLLEKMLNQPPPREVPDKIGNEARSPIVSVLTMIGAFMLLLDGGFLMAAPFLSSGGALGWWLPLGVVGLSGAGLFAYGIMGRRKTRKILARGRLHRGRVQTVSRLPAHINGRTFSRVRVRFEDSEGREVNAADTVDNLAVEYFLDARDEGREVDVLYAPDVPRWVILPARIPVTGRFD